MNLKRLLALPAFMILLLSSAQLLLACGVVQTTTEPNQAAITVIPAQPGAVVGATTSQSASATSTQIRPSPAATTPVTVSVHFEEPTPVITDIRKIIARSSVVVIGKVSGLGEIVNYARDPNDTTKPDPNQFVIGQVYHVQVESYLKGQGSSNVDVVAQEGSLYGPDVHKTPLDFEKIKANDQHIPLVPGTRYLIFLTPSFFAAQHYFDLYKEAWGYKLPLNGNAEIQGLDPKTLAAFPGKPSADLVADIKQIISQNPTVAATTMMIAVPTPTPNVVAKQRVNLVKLYGLDKAEYVSFSGIIIHEANKDQFFMSSINTKAVVASLNQDVTIMDNSLGADLSHEVINMNFMLARDVSIGFEYNIKTGIMSVLLPDKANRIRVTAPASLLHATGLDNLNGPAPTLPTQPAATMTALPVASTVAVAAPHSASTNMGGIAAIKPRLNTANANAATNRATFTKIIN